jgi:hypothetical protein
MTTMAGLKRSLKCDDLLTMTISHTNNKKDGEKRSSASLSKKEALLISQFVQLRTSSSSNKRQRFACSSSKKNPATAALACLEASWDYHSFQTAVAIN